MTNRLRITSLRAKELRYIAVNTLAASLEHVLILLKWKPDLCLMGVGTSYHVLYVCLQALVCEFGSVPGPSFFPTITVGCNDMEQQSSIARGNDSLNL
jgi:hypothetical protein